MIDLKTTHNVASAAEMRELTNLDLLTMLV